MKNEKNENEKWSIGLIGNLGENHETRIFFDSAAFSASAHKHMYFILSLNRSSFALVSTCMYTA